MCVYFQICYVRDQKCDIRYNGSPREKNTNEGGLWMKNWLWKTGRAAETYIGD